MKQILTLLLSTLLFGIANCRNDQTLLQTKLVLSSKTRNINYQVDKRSAFAQVKVENFEDPHLMKRLRAGAQTRQIGKKKAVLFGLILAFNSGLVNGITLSGLLSYDGTKQASAAVTGAWTNSALGAAIGNNKQFLFNTKCILSYFFGSFLSGMINPNPEPFQISVPSFRVVFFIGSILLYTSHIFTQKSNHTYLFLAAIANGMQNSLTSTTTANLVRSAHFSGITSDMGTFLGQLIRGNTQNLMKLKVFFSLAISFWTGSFLSYGLTKSLGKETLLLCSSLYLLLGLAVGLI